MKWEPEKGGLSDNSSAESVVAGADSFGLLKVHKAQQVVFDFRFRHKMWMISSPELFPRRFRGSLQRISATIRVHLSPATVACI
jgi:hypothetical protein